MPGKVRLLVILFFITSLSTFASVNAQQTATIFGSAAVAPVVEEAPSDPANPISADPAALNDQLAKNGEGLIKTIKAAINGDQVAAKSLMENYVLPAAMALILLIVGYLFAKFIGRIVGKTVTKQVDKTLGRFAGNLAKNLIIVMVLIGAMGYFGIDVTSFAAIIAALGFAVGMALQGTLGNFAAGIMLLIFRPYKIDDYIKCGDIEGTVEGLDLFTTSLNTLDNRHIIVPNGKMFGETLEHYTKNEVRRVDVNIGADYNADLDYTRQALEQAIARIPGAVASPAPQVYLCDLGDSSVNWQCRVWCQPGVYWDVRERVTEAAKNAFDEARIGIPFPQMDVHVVGKVLAKQAAA